MRTFTMIIERDKQGVYIGSIVELPNLHARGNDLDELRRNIREAIIIYTSFHRDYEMKELEFIGLQRIKVPLKELEEAKSSVPDLLDKENSVNEL